MTEKEPKKESEIIAPITGSRLQPLTTFEIWAASMLFTLNSSMRYTIRLISHPPAPRLNPATNPGPGKRHRYNWVQGRNIVAFERNSAYIYISTTWLYSLEKDLLWREMWSNRPVCYENLTFLLQCHGRLAPWIKLSIARKRSTQGRALRTTQCLFLSLWHKMNAQNILTGRVFSKISFFMNEGLWNYT